MSPSQVVALTEPVPHPRFPALFSTGFSKSSEAIIPHVVGLASAFSAKVSLLSVVSSLADFHGVSENYRSATSKR
jgi:hypothetical protein